MYSLLHLACKSENVLIKNVRFKSFDDTTDTKCVIPKRVPDSDFIGYLHCRRDLIRLWN